MPTQRGSLDLRAQKKASEQATTYLTDGGSDGLMVHPNGDSTTGWRIAAAIELLKSGVSYIKAWLDGSTPKVRVGTETGGNVLVDNDSVDINSGSDLLASLSAGTNTSTLWLAHPESNASNAYDRVTANRNTASLGIAAMHKTGTPSIALQAASGARVFEVDIQSAVTDATSGNVFIVGKEFKNGQNLLTVDVNGELEVLSINAISGIKTGSNSTTANRVMATPNGSTGAATLRALVAADLPTVTLAKGGTGASNTSVAINKVFAGPGSGSAGNASFRALVAADIPTLAVSKISALVGHAYGTCSTEFDVAQKTVECSGFVLAKGARIAVDFDEGNDYNISPSLDVNFTGAKPVYVGSSAGVGAMWDGGELVEFIYDGSTWQIQGRKAVLYESSTGSNTSVTLQKSIVGFNHLRIFFRENQQSAKSSIDVHNPSNGDKVSLIAVGLTGSTYQINAAPWYFSSNTVLRYASTNKNGFVNVEGTSLGGGTQAGIYVTRVEAWNE